MSEKQAVYRDPAQPLERRVEDLLSRMTIEEKVSQMLYTAKAVPRLGIEEYNWWNECLHGIARAGLATIFPQAIGLAASFDVELVGRIATAISDEARAKHELAVARGNRGQYAGLTFWTPNVNIFRDPRWGRGQETYGEDPFLAGHLGAAFVRGLQGNDPTYLKAAACAKHFAVHSGPEALRHSFDARVSKRELHETYLPAFKALVAAGVEAVMGAYNRVNGEPACASKELLVETLRGEWQFGGHVVSDCWAIADFHLHHKVTDSPVESVRLAVTRGCDLNCGDTYDHLLEAVRLGRLSEADIDRAVTRLLRTRFKLGMFDPPERVPYTAIPAEVIHCSNHIALARRAAAESMVLLRNKGKLLPLSRELKRVFVTGPNAASVDGLIGNYFGSSDRLVTPLEGIVAKLGPQTIVDYRKGLNPVSTVEDEKNLYWTAHEASHADVVIAVMGLDNTIEGEEGDAIASASRGDRDRIELPEHQVAFLRRLKEGGARTVLVLTGGSAIAFPEDIADAIIYAWYPGEAGGEALADLLFGEVVPSGRLPVTFPRSTVDLPPYEDYSMRERTYRYSTKSPLFPFGFGLSYTAFAYSDLTVTPEGRLAVTVMNTGSREGDEVVQVYVARAQAAAGQPIQTLAAVRRLTIAAGASLRVEFELPRTAFEEVDEEGRRALRPGSFRVTVGGALPGERSLELGAARPVEAVVEIE